MTPDYRGKFSSLKFFQEYYGEGSNGSSDILDGCLVRVRSIVKNPKFLPILTPLIEAFKTKTEREHIAQNTL